MSHQKKNNGKSESQPTGVTSLSAVVILVATLASLSSIYDDETLKKEKEKKVAAVSTYWIAGWLLRSCWTLQEELWTRGGGRRELGEY